MRIARQQACPAGSGSIALSVGVSAAVGLAFGSYPAMRAADLLIAVRKGRLVSVGGGASGTPTSAAAGGSPVGVGRFANAQVSSPDDMIEVFDRSGTLVWRGMKPNGLSGAGPPLWYSFRAEVVKQEKRTKKP